MIDGNVDASNGMANGVMGKFLGVVLKQGTTVNDLEITRIDDCRIHCASAHQVESLTVQMADGLNPSKIQLKATKSSADASIPLAFDGQRIHNDKRAAFKLKLKQFPVDIANARTVHKLQGQTLDCLGHVLLYRE